MSDDALPQSGIIRYQSEDGRMQSPSLRANGKRFSPASQFIELFENQFRTLNALRYTLLPKLLSGEMSI